MQFKLSWTCAAILYLIVSSFILLPATVAETTPPEDTLALVNNVAITKDQLDMELKRMEKPRVIVYHDNHNSHNRRNGESDAPANRSTEVIRVRAPEPGNQKRRQPGQENPSVTPASKKNEPRGASRANGSSHAQ